MKILLASIFILPNTGGLWTYVEQLKNSLEKEGHDVDILARHPNLQSYCLFNGKKRNFNIKIATEKIQPVLKTAFKDIMPMVDPQFIRWEKTRYIYEEAIENFGLEHYDLIHAQDIISAQAIACKKPASIPLILTVHGCYTKELLIGGVIKEKGSALWNYCSLLEYFGINSSDYTIFPSNHMKNMLVNEFYVPVKNLKVIPNAMDIQGFQNEMRKEPVLKHPHSNGKIVIACVARLRRIKGHKYLIKALSKLKKDRTDWVCWLIGDGNLKGKLKEKIRKLGIEEHIIFLGNRSDVPSLLKLVDICVLPSLQENCPYSIMESQAAGKCVIASRVGGIPEMIKNGHTGFLFTPRNSRSLYKRLKLLLKDEQLRNSIAENAGEWGRVHWSMERMLEDTLRIYNAALLEKKSDSSIVDLDLLQRYNLSEIKHPILNSIKISGENSAAPLKPDIPNPFFYNIIKELTLSDTDKKTS